MDSWYIGTIVPWAVGFEPVGWFFCQGQQLPINQYQALYALIGNTYGGDGKTYFNLPDLRQRVQIGVGQGPGLTNYSLGAKTGTETVTLTSSQVPAHNHNLMVNYTNTTCTSTVAPSTASVLGSNRNATRSAAINLYDTASPNISLNPASISPVLGKTDGSVDAHENRQPYLALNYIICWDGVFPSFS